MEKAKIEIIEQKIAKAITNTEFAEHVYIVGGYIRDTILERPTNDIDLVVSLPDGGIRLAHFLYEKKVSSYPVTFARFGTALIEIDKFKIELVMTRREFYEAGNRKPNVESGSIYEDAIRRDFTINALYRKVATTTILDITKLGFSDINAKIIRTTNDPNLVYAEDPLRMLRAIRFSAQIGFTIEPNTRQGIANNCSKLQTISWERRRDELSKMLLSNNPKQALCDLKNLNLLEYIIPEIIPLNTQKYNDEYSWWDISLNAVNLSSPNAELRFATLLHHISTEVSQKILLRLKFPNSFCQKIAFLIQKQHAFENINISLLSDKDIRFFVFEVNDNLELLLQLFHIINIAKPQANQTLISELRKRIANTYLPKSAFPINGNDIMKYLNVKSGKKIGFYLDKAYKIWLEYPDWDKKMIMQKLEKTSIN